MTKKRFIVLTILLVSILCLSGCGNKTNKQQKNSNESQNEKIETLENIDVGIYIGERVSEEAAFSPRLTLNEDKTYELAPTSNVVMSGDYHIDDGKVILTVSDSQSLTFKKNKNGKLVLQEEIPNVLKKETKFTLWGTVPKSGVIIMNDGSSEATVDAPQEKQIEENSDKQ